MSVISRMLGKLLNREEPRKEVEIDELKPMGWLDEMEPNKEDQEETLKSRRAVSPVIATVILVAITITVAVAVAYWMSGIAGQYTSFEKVEIQSGYATLSTVVGANAKWVITIELKNTGTATATLTSVFINDVPVYEYDITGGLLTGDLSGLTGPPVVLAVDSSGTSIPSPDGLPIESGAGDTVYIYIGSSYASLSPGTTINIKLHSAGGMDYIKLIQLT